MEEVLIIDDNQDITNAITDIIKYGFQDKYKITAFNDSKFALKYIKEKSSSK